MNPIAHGFVDGSYLHRAAAEQRVGFYPNPRTLVASVAQSRIVQSWSGSAMESHVRPTRVTFYDAEPEPPTQADEVRRSYWKAVELLEDTHLGFGVLRGEGRRRRQKGVDTLIAVDMLVGAFTQVYDLAILVAGDADFVPVVTEVRRRGAAVVVAADEESLSDDLRRAADRVVRIVPREPEGVSSHNSVVLRPMPINIPLGVIATPTSTRN